MSTLSPAGPKVSNSMILDLFLPSTGNTRELNRLEVVGETLRVALNAPAMVDPGWLRLQPQPD